MGDALATALFVIIWRLCGNDKTRNTVTSFIVIHPGQQNFLRRNNRHNIPPIPLRNHRPNSSRKSFHKLVANKKPKQTTKNRRHANPKRPRPSQNRRSNRHNKKRPPKTNNILVVAKIKIKIKIKTVGFHPTPRKLLKKFDQNFNFGAQHQNRGLTKSCIGKLSVVSENY